MSRALLTTMFLLLAVSACDPPPRDFFPGDAGSSGDTSEEKRDEKREGETPQSSGFDQRDNPQLTGTSCLEAVLCITTEPGDILDCTADMDNEARAIAAATALCIFEDCMETLDETVGLVICVASSCSEEALDCVTSSLGDLAP